MKALILFSLAWIPLFTSLMAEESRTLLRDALFAEEAQQDYPTAIKKYTTLLAQFEKERQVAVVAQFRLAEIHRKNGQNKQAAALYRRVLTEFPGMEPQNRMSRENLTALGEKLPTAHAGKLNEESTELARLKKLELTSPDLFHQAKNLRRAIDKNWLRLSLFLINKGADVNQEDLFIDTVVNGNLHTIEFLLNHGVTPNQQEMASALHLAAVNQYSKIFKHLIQKGFKIDSQNSLKFLHLTGKIYPLDVLKSVVEAGCDINVTQEWNLAPEKNHSFSAGFLHSATSLGRDEMVDYLIEKKININVAEKSSGITPLHLAIWKGRADPVSQLLKAGANINAYTLPSKKNSLFSYKSPLDLALEFNHLDIAKLLLKSQPKHLKRPLYEASRRGKIEWVKLLLNHGANPNGNLKSTPSSKEKTTKSGKSAIAEVLDLSLNPLGIALQNQHFKTADFLLSKGAILHENYLPYAPFKLRTQWMRAHRYPNFAKRSGVTLVLPEKPWDTELNPSSFSSSDIATALYELTIPRTLENPVTKKSGSTTITLLEVDQMTCILFRQGKQHPYDFHAETLPGLQAGDILEWTTFKTIDQKAATHYNRTHNYPRSYRYGPLMNVSSTALGPQIRRHIRVPIEVSINGKTSQFTLHGGLAVYDPRTYLVPLDKLSSVLTMIGIHALDGQVNIEVHRKGWKPLHFSLFNAESNAFALKPHDVIIVSMPMEAKDPTRHFVRITVPGSHFHSLVTSSPESPPTILQVLTSLNNGRSLTKENTSSLDSEWISTLAQPKKLANYLIRKHQFHAQLYNIDLAHITIRRHTKDNQNKIHKESISLDLEKIIREWDGTAESAKQHDIPLQHGDNVELQLKKGSWTGYTAKQKLLIESALSYDVMLSTTTQGIHEKHLRYRLPQYVQTTAGLIPIQHADDITSLQGSAWLKISALSIHRNNQKFSTPARIYWPRDGDQIAEREVRHIRAVPK